LKRTHPSGAELVRTRFQPTYEELKLVVDDDTGQGLLRFQPTYEELKQDKLVEIFGVQLSFQPTYEELKRDELGLTMEELVVSSLPMRN